MRSKRIIDKEIERFKVVHRKKGKDAKMALGHLVNSLMMACRMREMGLDDFDGYIEEVFHLYEKLD